MSPIRIEPESPAAPVQAQKFPVEADSEQYARTLDDRDSLKAFREQYVLPTKASLKSTILTRPDPSSSEPGIYFCGNSLGVPPKATSRFIQAHLDAWSSAGVFGHFTRLTDSPIQASWQNLAEFAAEQCAPLVGARPQEVGIMNSLTVNLHLLMASFYRPTAQKHKILLERKAFPSDHYAIESQIRQHGYDPAEAMIMLEPDTSDPENPYIIRTEKILQAITDNASEIALVLLPGIQYYTGQFFDIPTITDHTHSLDLTIGWDLAHAAANVPLQLHDWNVDFAAWCTYKYMNGGPGSIGGMFVHERHGTVSTDPETGKAVFKHRLMGWYGGDKASRFQMDNNFRPIPGAGGWQLSNPSALDISSVCGALSVFNETSMEELREKSLKLTAYLEFLLLKASAEDKSEGTKLFKIITPSDPRRRGAQLSVLLRPGLLKQVSARLQEVGIVADQREPDVIRVAPVPMYNTFYEVWRFVQELKKAVGMNV